MRAGAPLSAGGVLALQRSAGNAGTTRLMQRAAVQRLALQRDLPEGTDTTAVDALVDRVAGECDQWAAYKANPLSGQAMPGSASGLQTAVSRWSGGPVQPWMREYVRGRLGPLRTKSLNEMISMSGVGWPDYETLFDVSFQLPAHKYSLEMKAATSIIDKAVAKLYPTVTVTYSNAFGWHWTRDYRLPGVEMSAGVSVSAKQGKGVKPGGGLSGGPISLDISGSAAADPTPIRYSGPNDFGGAFNVIKASDKAHIGPAGGSLGALTAVVFHGTPSGDVAFPFIKPMSGSISGGKTDAGVDISLGGGIGVAIGSGEAKIDAPPVLEERTQLSPSFREWETVVGPFDTGSSFASEQVGAYLDRLKEVVYGWRTRTLDPQAPDLQAQSVDPARNFSLTFEVVGMASRSWGGAAEAARLARNQALSLRRAASVELEIHNRFPDTRQVNKQGTGAHAVGPSAAGQPAEMLDDAQAQALYETKKKEATAIADPVERKAQLKVVEANYGPGSDQQAARRVYVFCRWEGMMIQKVLVPVNASSMP